MSDMTERDERTEAPTPKRREEARKKGQVPRSRELATTSVVGAGALGLLALGPWMGARLEDSLRMGLTEPGRTGGRGDVTAALGTATHDALLTFAPLAGVLLLAAFLAPALLGGVPFSAEALSLKLERLDPLRGLKRIFSMNALVELAKTLLKFLVLSGGSAVLLAYLAGDLLRLGGMDPRAGLGAAASLVGTAFIVLVGGLLLIAAADVPYQIFAHLRELKMTRQEVKEELKETDGNPELRAKVRRTQQEVARRRMMSEVPLADVVLTNPTHYAVALRYTDRPDRAPRVVAKGRDLIAQRIREVAAEHGVPTCAAPALTRAIYFNAKLGSEIPTSLYLAVARVLAYVFELKAAAGRGAPPPAFPAELPVPGELAAPRGRVS